MDTDICCVWGMCSDGYLDLETMVKMLYTQLCPHREQSREEIVV